MVEELSLQAAPDPLRSERANMARRLSCRGRARNRSCAPLPRGKRARNGVHGGKFKPGASIRTEKPPSLSFDFAQESFASPPKARKGPRLPNRAGRDVAQPGSDPNGGRGGDGRR